MDIPTNRRKLANAAELVEFPGPYVPGWITHSVPAYALHWIEWKKIVREFISARRAEISGDPAPFSAFVKKRMARHFAERAAVPVLRIGEGGEYSKRDYWPAEGEPPPQWPQEILRTMGVDVGRGHFWVAVRAWRLSGDSRLIYEGRVESVEMLRELQTRLGIASQNVGIDCGYEPEKIAKWRWRFRDEIKEGGRIVGHACWVALKGDRGTGYPHLEGNQRNPVRRLRMYSPPVDSRSAEGVPWSFVKFSNLRAKDALAAAIEGAGGRRFDVFSDHSEAYGVHMKGESKREVRPGEYRWEKVRDKAPNHLWDAEVMGLTMASMRGILRPEED